MIVRTRILLVVLVAGLTACSGGDVTFEIDLLSFLNDAGESPDPNVGYAAPLLPTGVQITGIEIVPATEFRLVDVIDDLTVVDEGQLTYRIEAVNREGTGEATLSVRLASTLDGLDDPNARIDDIDVPLLPDSTTVATATVDLTGTLVDVFANDRVWVRIVTDLRVEAATAIGDSISGRLWLRGLDVRVVADEDFF